MNALQQMTVWLRSLLSRRRLEREMHEELRRHVEMQAEHYVREGMSREEARRAALRGFGGVAQVEEACREARGWAWIESLWQDLRYAVRSFRHSPVFTLTAVVCLGLGIGATTAIFTVVKGVLLAPLPYPNADRLVLLRSINPATDEVHRGISGSEFLDLEETAQSFGGMAAYSSAHLDLTGGTRTERVRGLQVTEGFFDVLGIQPSPGRGFTRIERTTRERVIVLGRRLWQRRFAADPNVIGRTLDVHTWRSLPDVGPWRYSVIGTVSSDFRFLPVFEELESRTLGVDDTVDFWLPLAVDQDLRDWRPLAAIARLKPDVSMQQAQAELDTIAARLAEAHPESRQWRFCLVPLYDEVVGPIRPALLVLGGAVGCLMLLAGVNVATLLLVRAVARRKELTVRAAVGAGVGRLARQLMTESLVLAALGCGVGVLLALWGVQGLDALAPEQLPRHENLHVDLPVLGFAAGLSLLAGLLVGTLPAWVAGKPDLNESLKSQGRSLTPGSSGRRALSWLVVSEVALATVLLIGAGLLIQSFARLRRVAPGFDAQNLLTMTVSLPEAKYAWKQNTVFCNQVIERLESLPGVVAVGAVRGLPLDETRIDVWITVEGRPFVREADRPVARIRVVSPDYFRAMGIPLLRGRRFEPRDGIGEIGYTRVALINKAMARRFWPEEDAIGKRFKVGADEIVDNIPWIEVIGVVGNVRYTGLDQAPQPDIYYPEPLFPQARISLVLRTQTNAGSLAGVVRREILAVERDALVTDIKTVEEVVATSLADRRFTMLLVSSFAAVALALAVTGNYGVVAYSVSQRYQEIGVRRALGATRADVLKLVLRRGLMLSGTGVLLGLVAALALGRALQSQLYGVSAMHPPTFAAVVLVQLAVGFFASYNPARRAAKIDPLQALRYE